MSVAEVPFAFWPSGDGQRHNVLGSVAHHFDRLEWGRWMNTRYGFTPGDCLLQYLGVVDVQATIESSGRHSENPVERR